MNNKNEATTRFYMNQGNKIVDILSNILPEIYYDVFQDSFAIFMYGLWYKTDEKHPPILDQSILEPGESIQVLENTKWNDLSKEKKIEWLKRMDVQALLKAVRFRPNSLKIFCDKNSLVEAKMVSVLQAMINWRNYGVGHKSVYKYEKMDESVFKINILEPVWEFYDLLSRNYQKECEKLRKTLLEIEQRMKLPIISIDDLIIETRKPEKVIREVLGIMRVYVDDDGQIKGEDEKELVDSIKRLSKKESVQKKQQVEKNNAEESDESNKTGGFSKRRKIIIAIIALVALIIALIVVLTNCSSKQAEKKKTEKNNNTEVITDATTVKEIDNRKAINPFDYCEIKYRYANLDEEVGLIPADTFDEEEYNKLLRLEIKNKYNSDFGNLIFDVYDDATASECYKLEENGNVYLVPSGTKVLISLSQDSIDEYGDQYRFEPESKTMVLNGEKLVEKISDVGSYKSKKLKKIREHGVNAVKSEGNKASNVQYLGYFFRKRKGDTETATDDEGDRYANVYLVLVYKAKVEYTQYSPKIDCYFTCELKDPIIKKGQIYNKIGKLKFDTTPSYYRDIDFSSDPIGDMRYSEIDEYLESYYCTEKGHIPKK